MANEDAMSEEMKGRSRVDARKEDTEGEWRLRLLAVMARVRLSRAVDRHKASGTRIMVLDP